MPSHQRVRLARLLTAATAAAGLLLVELQPASSQNDCFSSHAPDFRSWLARVQADCCVEHACPSGVPMECSTRCAETFLPFMVSANADAKHNPPPHCRRATATGHRSDGSGVVTMKGPLRAACDQHGLDPQRSV